MAYRSVAIVRRPLLGRTRQDPAACFVAQQDGVDESPPLDHEYLFMALLTDPWVGAAG